MFRLLFFLLFTHAALALEIKQTRWGFDGKVVPNRFNLLSVLVAQESGARPFEGELMLGETHGGDQILGAPLVQALYLTPGTERWVQFLAFVTQENEWRLTWGKGEKMRAPVPEPKFGPPATVALLDLSSVLAANTRLAGFSEELFPTSVAATDGLDQVVLDHVPRWDPPRREGFLDWLRRGGIVHLLRGPEGHPRFEGDLAVLNFTEESASKNQRVGAGRVVRHEAAREECDEAFLTRAGFAPREFQKPDKSGHGGVVLHRFDQTLLQNLASLTKPQVQWWLLYLLTISYLAFIGPVHYFWSRKVDWRIALGGFLGTVAVFALAFILAGHRGSGERQTSHALAIAHSLGGERWDVREWVSAFATKGDFYRLAHAAPANFYAVPSDAEPVNARAIGGKDGHLDADIPLYSARPFLHRAVMRGPKAEVKVVEWKSEGKAVEIDTSFPDTFIEAYVSWGGSIAKMERSGQRLRWKDAAAFTPGGGVFDETKLRELQQFEWSNRAFKPATTFMPLLAFHLGDPRVMPNALTPRPLSPDHAQLFLFAEAPDSFAMQGKGFDRGHGHVLYVIDIFRPSEPTP